MAACVCTASGGTVGDRCWRPRKTFGKVYCAVVLDVYSHRVVGWSIDSTLNAAPVTNALWMAIDTRRPNTGTTCGLSRAAHFSLDV
ncbi:DDE-type integrase/transposase/recombinase [Nocardia sp. NPDC004123]